MNYVVGKGLEYGYDDSSGQSPFQTAIDLQILPADGRELPYADGWRILRSIAPIDDKGWMMLWARESVK